MYSYYGLSAIPAVRPYLWWKKYITQFQLVGSSCSFQTPRGLVKSFKLILRYSLEALRVIDAHIRWASKIKCGFFHVASVLVVFSASTQIFLALDQYCVSVGSVCVCVSPPHCSLCYVSSTDPVLFNHVSDAVCGRLAVWIPDGLAVLPNRLHGHTHFPFLKLLRSGQWSITVCIYKLLSS